MVNSLTETLFSRSLPVIAEVDIAIAGGSCTGVFAAVTAARLGAKCALIESQNRFGGTATAGQVCYWHSLFNSDYSTQIIAGLTQEVIDRMKRRGLVEFWKEPNPHWYVNLNTEELCCELDEMVAESGILPFLHTRVADVLSVEEGVVTGLVVAGKDGLSLIKAKYFIDATGDADLVRRAGGECFSEENQLSSWAIEYDATAQRSPRNLADHLKQVVINRTVPEGRFRGISGESVSRMIRESRRELRNRYRKLYAEGRTRDDCFPLLVPTLANFRRTFSIRGRLLLTPELSGEQFDDSVGLFGNWITPGPVHELPYRVLLPAELKNVWAAGRCISVTGETCELTRVIPVAAMSGEIAGTAAALAADAGSSAPGVAGGRLQEELRRVGFRFHREEL